MSATSSPSASPHVAGDTLDLGRCFDEALAVYKRHFWTLVIAALVFELVSIFTIFILTGPLCGGLCVMTMAAVARPDQPIDIGLMFSRMGRFGRLLGLFYLTTIAVLAACLLLIVPGIVLAAAWLYVFYFVADLDLTIGGAMKASWRTVQRGGFGPHLLLNIIVMALTIVPALIPYLGFFLGLVLSPLAWLLVASAYLQMVRGREQELGDLGGRGFAVAPVAPAV